MGKLSFVGLALALLTLIGCGGSSSHYSASAPADPQVVQQEDEAVSAAEMAEAVRQVTESGRP